MTVSSQTNRVEYAGNGSTTSFAFPYLFLLSGDLSVILRDPATGLGTNQALNTDYTVTGAGDPDGGSVNMTTPPASGLQLIIYRNPDVAQPVNNVNGEPLDVVAGINLALDRATLIMQRLKEIGTRSYGIPRYDLMSSVTNLPSSVARANGVFCFDALGDPLIRELSDFGGGGGGGGSFIDNDVSVANNYTVVAGDGYVRIDCTAGDKIVTFTPADNTLNKNVRFRKTSGAHNLIITPDGSTVIYVEASTQPFTIRRFASTLEKVS